MKNIKNIIGIIVFAAVIILTTVSCWSPTGDSSGSENKGNEIRVVDIAAIEGVAAPVTGGIPVTTITENEQYSGTVTWEPEHSAFEPKTHYTATITLTAKTGFSLQGVAANFFTVAETISVNNAVNSGIVTAVFPSTGGTETDPVVIELAVIEGISIPVTGETPVTVIEHVQYTGTVTWEPNHSVFESKTEYTATIILTAKTGFTLHGVDVDFFTVKDAISTTNSANSGVVIAVFPSTAGTSTDPAVIDIAAIHGIPLPVTGERPVTHITENAQFSGTVSWNPNHSVFTSKTEYTATITLTAKEGYTLQGVEADFFTVEDAISSSNSANSGVITAVFPSTAGTSTDPAVIDIAGIEGIPAPIPGRNPVTHITETEQYTGTVEWSPVVPSSGTVRIVMYDSYEDGWNFGAALRINKNGVDFSTVGIVNGAVRSYDLKVFAGDVVQVYWIEGMFQEENSFVMYYIDAPPSPAFDPEDWNGSNALVYRLYETMDDISDGELLGSFTVNANFTIPKFVSATQYTATITLTPKTGYTLQGVEANFFTVAGATSANNLANSGVITAPFPRATYALGDTGPGGGKIFYVSEEGFTMTDTGEICHYLEAAPTNMPTTLRWATSDYEDESIPDAKWSYGAGGAQSLGAGRNNTAAILGIDANAPAAKACADYSNNGMTDWFLPSCDEQTQMWNNRSYIGNIAGTQNYWSSTEAVFANYSAWGFNFNGGATTTQGKSNALNVRAIRAF